MEAQSSAVIARLEAQVVTLAAKVNDTVTARLSGLKDGEPGPRGEQGPAGDPGPKGDIGETGPEGRGLPGHPGERGERGEAGVPGSVGERGAPGEVGPRGEMGTQGERGLQGESGLQGEKGLQGEPGLCGALGPQGEKGEVGEVGPRGEAGPVGPPGERGLPGPAGEMRAVKAYKPDTVHYVGDIVTHEGSTFQARCDTGRAPPHSDWVCLALAGCDATMPTICGTFNETHAYCHLDIVALNGSSFCARKDDPGPCPGAGWQLIASAGKPGKPGPKGECGERGERGERGLSAPAFVKWEINKASYTVTAVMSDHSKLEPLSLRTLFEQYNEDSR